MAKWHRDIKRQKGIPLLDKKIRDFKLNYIEAKQGLGGFVAEGELLLLEEVRKDPTAWDITKVRDQVYSQLWRSIWHEDDDPEDGVGLPLFTVAGIEVQRTLTIPDPATTMRKVSARWATAGQALRLADLKDLKARQTAEAATRIRQVGEAALARGHGEPATRLYDVRDGSPPPPRPSPSPIPGGAGPSPRV